MITAKKIEALLISAMKNSCQDAYSFSDDQASGFKAEYLLTVNVAKSLRSLNFTPGDPYKIYLEHSTKKFSFDCCPSFLAVMQSKLPKTAQLKAVPPVKRVGRLDVAVYGSEYGLVRPICAIEAKGFNPAKSAVIRDLERNAAYFDLIGQYHQTDLSAKSALKFAFFVAIFKRSVKKSSSINDMRQPNEDSVRQFIKECCDSIKLGPSIKLNLEVCSVSHDAEGQTELDTFFNCQGEVVELPVSIPSSRHHFVGVIVRFERESASSGN